MHAPRALPRLRLLPASLRLAALDAALSATHPARQAHLLAALARDARRPRSRAGARALDRLCLALGEGADQRPLADTRAALADLDEQAIHASLDRHLASDQPDRQAAAARLIGCIPFASLADRLPPLLSARDTGTAEAAERALARLADWLFAARIDGRAITAGPVGAAIHDAIDRFGDHRRAGVLSIIFSAAARGVRLTSASDQGAPPQWLTSADHAAIIALRRHLRADEQPDSLAAAWNWLAAPTLAGAAASRLCRGGPGVAAVFQRSHLVLAPARRDQLARLVGPDGGAPASLLPSASNLPALPATARRGIPRVLALLPASGRLADAALASLLTDPDAAVRHAAVRAATFIPSRPPALADFAFDAHPRVARTAALALACRIDRGLVRDSTPAHALAVLTRSPHRAIARLARDAAAPDALQDPASPLARLALRRELLTSPARALGRLAGALRGPEHPRAAAAASLARALGLGDLLADDLAEGARSRLSAASPAEARALSAIVSALGYSRCDASRRLLMGCAAHADPRVRANAIDALARRARLLHPGADAPVAAILASHAGDPAHRPRASAARALLAAAPWPFPRPSSTRDPGERALLGLLHDARPMHRLAGLWLAERVAPRVASLPEIVDAVASLAKAHPPADAEPRLGAALRDRARRAGERLIAEIRQGWSARAMPETEAPQPLLVHQEAVA